MELNLKIRNVSHIGDVLDALEQRQRHTPVALLSL
jgi:hypothetical protein